MSQEDKLKNWYNDIALKYDTWGNRDGEVVAASASLELNEFKRLLSRITIPKYWSVFEVAVGTGNYLKEFVPFAKRLGGIDISQEMVEISKKKLSVYKIPTDIRISSASSLPVDYKSYDVVIAIGLFEYYTLKEVQKILSEMKRISTQNAFFIVDFPIANHPAFLKFKSAEESVGHNVYSYPKDEIADFLKSLNLIVVFRQEAGMEAQYLLKKK